MREKIALAGFIALLSVILYACGTGVEATDHGALVSVGEDDRVTVLCVWKRDREVAMNADVSERHSEEQPVLVKPRGYLQDRWNADDVDCVAVRTPKTDGEDAHDEAVIEAAIEQEVPGVR